MKKIIVILIINLFFVNSYPQISSRILSFTFGENYNVGLSFVSKPLLQLPQNLSFYGAFEYGNYEQNLQTKILKLQPGISISIKEDFNLNVCPSFNFYEQTELSKDAFNEISLEVGPCFQFIPINKTFLSLMFDPINLYFKFGFGYGF